MNEFLYYPQENLDKIKRKLNIFIGDKIFNKKNIIEVKCNRDIESGLAEICLSLGIYKKAQEYGDNLILPAYLDEEIAITSDEFFEQIVFINDDKNFGNYEKQKENFLSRCLSYNGYHISSYKLLPNYCEYEKCINFAIETALKKNLINEKDFLINLSKIINYENEIQYLLSSPLDRAKALYETINNSDIEEENKNILCFFNKK